MPIQRATPAPKAQAQAPVEKYPIHVMEKEYEGKEFLCVTTNPNNHKFAAFSGGAAKIKTLFGVEKGGDVVLKLLAEWAVEKGGLTKQQLVAWYEKFSSQFEQLISNDDEFQPV